MTTPDTQAPTSTAAAVVRLGGLALAFGRVDRITYHPDGVTPESDTDHTVMLGLLACALAQKWFPGLNVGRVAQYALVHDLVEVYAGDTNTLRALDDAQKADKRTREMAAAMRLDDEFGELSWLSWTLMTYENQDAPEARFVKMLDKLMPKITHILNGAVTIHQQGMTRDELVARYEAQGHELGLYADQFPEVEELRRALVAEVLTRLDEQGSDHTDG
ncbi:MAG TPA: HD domain-containing protein [Nocardioides sp.]